jgi:hypothetical protein
MPANGFNRERETNQTTENLKTKPNPQQGNQ